MDKKRITTSLNYDGLIRISMNTLEALEYPKDLLLLINESEHKIAYEPCDKNERRKIVIKYSNSTIANGRYINSKRFTSKVYDIEKWDKDFRYQIPGELSSESNVVVFDLMKARPVKNNTNIDDDDDDMEYDINFEEEDK